MGDKYAEVLSKMRKPKTQHHIRYVRREVFIGGRSYDQVLAIEDGQIIAEAFIPNRFD